ncbi:uncharacterized protein LOC126458509 [Schistocerca serialis cubense]|uniref:uncharacterized protein LOC126458509 n=1 Tax=Schistocerca serialis cubense TaxID=2023355 RepID=UPI00214E083A|nr:uncharacterized protein LOC126458509 [Schistocerca serialis cubense]
MNFGSAFSDAESSSGSASSTYSPRRTKDEEECIDLRHALTSAPEDEHTDKKEDAPREESAHVPVSGTGSPNDPVQPLSLNNEQQTSVSGVKTTTTPTVANYCEIHDTSRERFEIEFLKNAVIKMFDMNPQQLKDYDRNVPAQEVSSTTSTPRVSGRTSAHSPSTPKNIGRKTTQLMAKETDEGIFVRAWRSVVRFFQRKVEPTQGPGQQVSNERTVPLSSATISPRKRGPKASEVNERDPKRDGTTTLRVPTLSPIDEVLEPTTSGSSAFGTGPSSSEVNTSSKRKASTNTISDTVK